MPAHAGDTQIQPTRDASEWTMEHSLDHWITASDGGALGPGQPSNSIALGPEQYTDFSLVRGSGSRLNVESGRA